MVSTLADLSKVDVAALVSPFWHPLSCSSGGAMVSTFANLSKVDVVALVSSFWPPLLSFSAVTCSMMFRACKSNL